MGKRQGKSARKRSGNAASRSPDQTATGHDVAPAKTIEPKPATSVNVVPPERRTSSAQRAIGAEDTDDRATSDPSEEHEQFPATALRVRVVHGSLDRLAVPVCVGHYEGDLVFGAEGFLDDCLEGRMRRRHACDGLYPGAAGSGLYVAAPEAIPPGALIVGLGPVGELAQGMLTQGVRTAALQMAIAGLDHAIDRASDSAGTATEGPIDLHVAALLIGTRGGQSLSARQSIVAITNGVLLANRQLRRSRPKDGPEVRFVELSFVELWADIAIDAARVVKGLKREPSLICRGSESVAPEAKVLRIEGARGNSRQSTDWRWWRRIIVSEILDERQHSSGLHFTMLGERARAEDRVVNSVGRGVDKLIAEAIRGKDEIGRYSISKALYQLLLPQSVKDRLFDGDDLVFVLDKAAAQFPWELLARGRGRDEEPEPLVLRVKVIRQLRTETRYDRVVAPSGRNALVLASPADVPRPIEGAREEGTRMTALLKSRFTVASSIGEGSSKVLQRLYDHDYSIIHVAAHGCVFPDRPKETGIVLGDGAVITADFFTALPATPDLVFLNCCELGKMSGAGDNPAVDGALGKFAASIAETLIGMGVRCVIVAGWAVDDDVAAVFAETFYRGFLGGREFGEAVHAARKAAWSCNRESTTWGAYQCYGDPSFRLPQTPRTAYEETVESSDAVVGDSGADRSDDALGSSRKSRFVAAREAREELEDILGQAASVGTVREQSKYLRDRLDAITTEIMGDEQIREDGDLLTTLAETWGQLAAEGESLRKAIEYFRSGLKAESGGARVRAMQKLAVLLDLRGDVADDEGRLPIERSVTLGPTSERWFELVEGLGPTATRHEQRALQQLRRAVHAAPSDQAAVLAAAEEHFVSAAKRREEKVDPELFIPRRYLAILSWARVPAGDDRSEVAAAIAAARESLFAATGNRTLSFSSMHAAIDLDLLEVLCAVGRPPSDAAATISRRYRKFLRDFGAELDRRPVRDTLALLRTVAASRNDDACRSLIDEVIRATWPDDA